MLLSSSSFSFINRILSTQVNINESQFSKGEKVSSLDLLLEQSDRKITRNQKRKHDEINHVQKVCLCVFFFFFLFNNILLINFAF
jgi:hypothetical protein